MADFLSFTVIGVAVGAIYAIAASGLVVTYATSGIFNFAHGAVGMFSAFLYWQFRWDWNFPAPLAIFLVIFVFCPIFGALLERFVMRGLQNTMEITKLVVPIALLLLLTGSASWIWGDPIPETLRRFFGPDKKITIGDTFISWHHIIVLIVAVLMAAGLYVVLYKMRIGVNMRAVVDNPELTQLNGGRPVLAASFSWMIGTALAGLAGVLIGSLQNAAINNLALTLLIVDAYAAAIFGKLRSLTLTFVGAIVVGLSISYWNWLSDTGQKWTWLSGFRISIPVVLLVIVLILLPHERLRGAVVSRFKERFSVPTIPKAALWAGVLVLFFAAAVPIAQRKPEALLSTGLAFGIIALSLVLLTGYGGELNLAPLTFAGIGAVVAYQFEVNITKGHINESLSIWGLLLAAAVCALVGAIIALPALRLRGLYQGLVTFGFAIFVTNMVFKQRRTLHFNLPWYGDGEDFEINIFTGGGLFVPRPNWFGIDFRISNSNYMVFLAVVFALIGLGLVALRRSTYGRRLAAMKDSPAASATLGMSLVKMKLSVFALSSAIAGVGGVLYAAQQGASDENSWVITASLPLVLLTVVAGVGYVSGAFAGGILTGVFFVMLGDVFLKLSVDYSAFEWLFTDVVKDFFIFVGPAFAAISLATSPAGFLNDMFDNYRPLTSRRGLPLLSAWVVFQSLFYLWRITDGIGTWTFMLVSLGVALLLPAIAQVIRPDLYIDAKTLKQRREELPLELVGVDRPITAQDVKQADAALQLPVGVSDNDGRS